MLVKYISSTGRLVTHGYNPHGVLLSQNQASSFTRLQPPAGRRQLVPRLSFWQEEGRDP